MRSYRSKGRIGLEGKAAIKKVMALKEVTQRSLAERLDLDEATISFTLGGNISLSPRRAMEIYRLLGGDASLEFLHNYGTTGEIMEPYLTSVVSRIPGRSLSQSDLRELYKEITSLYGSATYSQKNHVRLELEDLIRRIREGKTGRIILTDDWKI